MVGKDRPDEGAGRVAARRLSFLIALFALAAVVGVVVFAALHTWRGGSSGADQAGAFALLVVAVLVCGVVCCGYVSRVMEREDDLMREERDLPREPEPSGKDG
jgi:hypothetical protein